jgi:hypothetical protein
MGMLDDRKRGAEERFRLEQEFEFKLTARRNRLFGKWAADTLGLTGNEADEYTKSVMFADLQAPGDDDLLSKVERDFVAGAVKKSRAQLCETLERLAEEARIHLATK